MKVEFLNDGLTEARLTKGWFGKKKTALVKMGHRNLSYSECADVSVECWVFSATDRYVGWWTDWNIDAERSSIINKREKMSRKDREWVEVTALPKATIRTEGSST